MVNLSNNKNTIDNNNNKQDYNSDNLPTLRKQLHNLITN
jgi:hypothetical protein